MMAILFIAFAFFSASISRSQEPPATAVALDSAAVKAYQAKNFAQFLEYEKRALALEPANPRFAYNVACGESLTGAGAEAVKVLDKLVARKLDLNADNDDDFASIHNTPEWAEFKTRLAELRKPIANSHVAFTLDDPALVATGMTIDPRTGDTYIASVRERKIVRRTKDGKVSDFIRQGQDGFMSADWLAIDSPRRLLYATTAAVPFMLDYQKPNEGRSGVFAFDLKTGKLVRKVMLPADGTVHILNAMVVDRGGTVYTSDSAQSGIYRLRPGSDQIEVFVARDVFRAAQGLAFSKDERTLYVADYVDGVWALDMATKVRRHLEGPADVWLGGLDGLSQVGDSLLSVQIGVKPNRVLKLRLSPHGDRIDSAAVLEMGRLDYDGPIQGVVTGDSFLYVANSQLSLGNGQTGAFASDRAKPTIVLQLPLQPK
ncbi:MAG TPA: L-dopachrome tautomerase-related protein [Blastocatellia bacterium]|nr:L-dopachrome tautomerase-related protein [Blastocatellia bacterium]